MYREGLCLYSQRGRGSGSIQNHFRFTFFPLAPALEGGVFIHCAAALGPKSGTAPLRGLPENTFLGERNQIMWEACTTPHAVSALKLPQGAQSSKYLWHSFIRKSFCLDPCLICFSLNWFKGCTEQLPGNQGRYSWLFLSALLLPSFLPVPYSVSSLSPPDLQDHFSWGFV